MSSLIQSSQNPTKEFENQPLSIQGENTSKQAARRAAAAKGQARASTQVANPVMVSPTSLKTKDSALSNVRRQSRDSANEYEADEFEKEDLVQMAEP